MKKELLVIVNPRSGRNKRKDDFSKALEVFSNHGYKTTVLNTTKSGDATDYAKENCGKYDLIVCRGGDGTFCEMMNGVMSCDQKPDIGFIPAGTTNDLANTLGLPSKSAKAAQLIMSETARPCDIGVFNGRYFTYVASFGAFTKCSYAAPQSLKNKIGRTAYFYEAAKEIKDIRAVPMRCTVDGTVFEGNFIFGAISNSYTVGKIIHMNEDTVCLNDGKFEVLLAENPGSVKGWKDVAACVVKKDFTNEHLRFIQGSHIEIQTLDGSEIPWTLDGEFGGDVSRVTVDIQNNAFRLFRPPLINEMVCADAEQIK